ncbi:guanitoxin biosynthesis heme-dependent pre-guanitoxin N-hydroxylase GntA [Pleionea sediminis]|uniref:guanitoxin biosynthesis heme-dependent pre-guanitoxin N-hydroxylase GntA n=1 Tax=Pleionea sediminis TaxID=2569479 RepID=UPI001185A98B|nr:guanitoxin biosynthesis heme-dependent pre-guanitoxin N-hydroxylase GntA [Pleionea sediminis]
MSTLNIEQRFKDFVSQRHYPCPGAKSAVKFERMRTCYVDDFRSVLDAEKVLESIYQFIDAYDSDQEMFLSLAVFFKQPLDLSEVDFERYLWLFLQRLHDLDSRHFSWAPNSSSNPANNDFSFSLGERKLFVIGMHPNSNRKARRFEVPLLVFNMHDQFQRLRESGDFERYQTTARKKDITFSGSINPNLSDFGEASEARQYSGRIVEENWTCPFKARG